MKDVARIDSLIQRDGGLVTIDASVSVATAAGQMKANNIGCLIVLDGKDVIGILSERDIVEQVVATSADPAAIEVRHIMTEHIVSAPSTATISEVHRLMASHGIRHIPIINKGVPVGIISCRDLLDQALEEANLRLMEVTKQAEKATNARHELLSNVSHEIRTPMNGIIGMTDLAMDTKLTTEQRGCLGIVRDSAESLLNMINELLDFSGIEAGKIVLYDDEFALREIIGMMIGTLGRKAEAKGLSLTCRVAPDIPEHVFGDAARLCQVLVNVVDNAIKFTDTGHISVRLETEEWQEKDVLLHFLVADTGIGIPADKHQSVFEAFRYAEDAYKRSCGGMGLGLAIASHLVDLMGGKIWFESRDGGGTQFHFTARLELCSQSEAWEYHNQSSV